MLNGYKNSLGDAMLHDLYQGLTSNQLGATPEP